MDFGNGVEINFEKLTDEQSDQAFAELLTNRTERGLWVPEGVGQIAVAGAVDIEAERARLLDTVEVGTGLFNDTIYGINSRRSKKNQIPVSAPGLYREQAEDWLTNKRVVAATNLPETANRRPIVFPKLSRRITTEEIVASWDRASDHRLYPWDHPKKSLANWTADQLSGYDPVLKDADRFAIIPTAYDADREGAVAQQKTNLEILQQEFPEISVTPIFEGSLLGRLCEGQSRSRKDSYVRGIDLKPARVGVLDCVPYAFVSNNGYMNVDVYDLQIDFAARLQVR